jgi:hypothetical protein
MWSYVGRVPEIGAPFSLRLVRSAVYSIQEGFIFKKRQHNCRTDADTS